MDSRHLILYDGVCYLCDRLNLFVLPRDPDGIFCFASIQSATGRRVLQEYGKNPDDLNTFYVVRNYRSNDRTILTQSSAGLFVCEVLGGPWKMALALRVLPGFILDWGYDLIARHRYRMFGRHDTCLLPRPEYRGRFLDTQAFSREV